MKFILKLFLVFVIFHFGSEFTDAQVLIRVEKPFIANKLAGIVKDPSGGVVPGVKVCKFNKEWKKLINCLETNENGKFSFPKSETLNYLKFFASGFNELEVKIKLVKDYCKQPEFVLELAL